MSKYRIQKMGFSYYVQVYGIVDFDGIYDYDWKDMALNWKIWEHYKTNDAYGRLYNDLWMKTDEFARDTLQGDELMYYYSTTD